MAARQTETRFFSYQDSLRAIGAWLDIRGYSDVRIVESDGELVIEARPGERNRPNMMEIVHFDSASVLRLRQAALSDRGAPHAPLSLVPTSELTPLYRRSDVSES